MLDFEARFPTETFHSFNKYLLIPYCVRDLRGESDPGPALTVVSVVAGEAP